MGNGESRVLYYVIQDSYLYSGTVSRNGNTKFLGMVHSTPMFPLTSQFSEAEWDIFDSYEDAEEFVKRVWTKWHHTKNLKD